ncbi:UNKNOWN [Stylonychia lemnae]|uniref:Transmembrane protein n=1 Tax=Stylonychia lemnae TaxID=5949 RepID=A0A078B269_STYLE|nr:UNKNOWN [Stylonychia lemnae]|eukprot:CDW88635.1 UNKNOWN [Stylonychia lemnae]
MHALKDILEQNIEPVTQEKKHIGLILYLVKFDGSVYFYNNVFKDIIQSKSPCTNNQTITDPSAINGYFENVIYLNVYQLQFQNLISIISMKQGFINIEKNKFENILLTNSLIRIQGELDKEVIHALIEENSFLNIIVKGGAGIIHFEKQNMGSAITKISKMTKCGGGLTIKNNTFKLIIGCEMVDSSLFFIGCYNQDYYFSQPYMLSQESQYEKFQSDYQVLNKFQEFQDNLIAASSKTSEKVAVQKMNPTTSSINLASNLDPNRIILYLNTYEDCYRGVTMRDTQWNSEFLGTLISFVNIPWIEVDSEEYLNIGPFNKNQFDLIAKQLGIQGSLTLQQDYIYNQLKGCCIFSLSGVSNFSITGTSFQNVWTIDDAYVAFKSIGTFNSLTTTRYGWNPLMATYKLNNKVNLGASQPLFYINFQNCTSFTLSKFNYHDNYAQFQEDSDLSLIVTVKDQKNPFRSIKTKLIDVQINSVYADRGAPFFEIQSSQIDLENVYIQDPIFKINILSTSNRDEYFNVKSSIFSEINGTDVPLFMIASTATVTSEKQIVKFQSTNFYSNIGKSAAILKIPENLMNGILFNDCIFSKNIGDYGLMRVTAKIGTIQFQQCEFSSNYGKLAKDIYIEGSSTSQMLIYESRFKQTEVDSQQIRDNIIDNDHESYFLDPSGVVLISIQQVKIVNSRIENYHFAQSGGFIRLESNSKAEMINCNIQESSANQGGAILIQKSSEIILNGCTIELCQAYQSGAVQAQDTSTLTIISSKFVNNFGVDQGVFSIQGYSKFSCDDCFFQANEAYTQNSVGQIVQSQIASMTNSRFFSNFISPGGSYNLLQIISSKVTFSLFYNTLSSIGFEKVNGNFIQIMAESSIEIKDSTFKKGMGKEGGAIYMLGFSQLVIENCNFTDCSVDNQGGAIYASSFDKIDIINSRFEGNKAKVFGSAIYASNSIGTLNVNKSSYFYSKDSSNFIYFSSLEKANITATTLASSSIDEDTSSTYSAIYLDSLKLFYFSQSTMKQIVANYTGGCMYISEAASSKQTANFDRYFIDNSVFSNCKSLRGGAIFLDSVQGVTIGNKTTFSNNYAYVSKFSSISDQAEGIGGAVNFYCQTGGGAIQWNYLEPTFKNVITQRLTELQVNYKNNTAGVYGDNISSVSRVLQQLTKDQYLSVKAKFDTSTSNERMIRALQDNSQQGITQKQKSGGVMDPIYFALIDKYGFIVTSDETSKLYLQVNQNSNYKYQTTFETETTFSIKNGVFAVDNLVVVAQPNSQQSFSFSTDGIDYNIPDNAAYYLEQKNQLKLDTVQKNLGFSLTFRDCEPGEALLSSGKCSDCSEGTYLLITSTGTSSCKECQSDISYCLGKDLVYPMKNYWRSSKSSDNFIKCRNHIQCLGMNPPENNFLGACAEGYQGILCSDCKIGYSITNNFECSKCPDDLSNSFKLLALSVLIITALVFLIKFTIAGALEQKNYLSVFIRILMNHIQLLIITASYDLQWPDQLIQFFNSVKPASEVTTQFLSLDCFIDTRKDNNDKGTIRSFYAKTIMLALAPILAVITCFCAWRIIFYLQERKKNKISNRKFDINLDQSSQRKGLTTQQVNTTNQEEYEKVSNMSIISKNPLNQQKLQSMETDGEIKMTTDQLDESQESIILQEQDRRRGRVVSSVIIILFFIHPTITTQMFSAFRYLLNWYNLNFSCQDIDGQMRLYSDLEVICYSGLGIPAYGFFLLFINKDKLQNIYIKEKYSFLYNGYKGHSFFWEIFIIYRKIIFIFIQVFLAQVGKIVQHHYLNNLETLSLLSSALTIYCGLFYISGHEGLSVNGMFLIYWIIRFMIELKQTISLKFPRIYFAMFLCFSQKKREKEKMLQDYLKKHTKFIKNYSTICEYLVQNMKLYNSGLIPPEDSELQLLTLKLMQFKAQMDNSRKLKSLQNLSVEQLLIQKDMNNLLKNNVKNESSRQCEIDFEFDNNENDEQQTNRGQRKNYPINQTFDEQDDEMIYGDNKLIKKIFFELKSQKKPGTSYSSKSIENDNSLFRNNQIGIDQTLSEYPYNLIFKNQVLISGIDEEPNIKVETQFKKQIYQKKDITSLEFTDGYTQKDKRLRKNSSLQENHQNDLKQQIEQEEELIQSFRKLKQQERQSNYSDDNLKKFNIEFQSKQFNKFPQHRQNFISLYDISQTKQLDQDKDEDLQLTIQSSEGYDSNNFMSQLEQYQSKDINSREQQNIEFKGSSRIGKDISFGRNQIIGYKTFDKNKRKRLSQLDQKQMKEIFGKKLRDSRFKRNFQATDSGIYEMPVVPVDYDDNAIDEQLSLDFEDDNDFETNELQSEIIEKNKAPKEFQSQQEYVDLSNQKSNQLFKNDSLDINDL